MRKIENFNTEIQKRLPNEIVFINEKNIELTEDEFLAILSWIKYFNIHFKEHGMTKYPKIMFPVISKKLRLDFGLYRTPSDIKEEKGLHAIYLSVNINQPIKKTIISWKL